MKSPRNRRRVCFAETIRVLGQDTWPVERKEVACQSLDQEGDLFSRAENDTGFLPFPSGFSFGMGRNDEPTLDYLLDYLSPAT